MVLYWIGFHAGSPKMIDAGLKDFTLSKSGLSSFEFFIPKKNEKSQSIDVIDAWMSFSETETNDNRHSSIY